jgi:hypothetical protein
MGHAGHTYNYFYGTDNAVITIIADTQDESYNILCELLKTPPEMIKLFDSESVDKRKE